MCGGLSFEVGAYALPFQNNDNSLHNMTRQGSGWKLLFSSALTGAGRKLNISNLSNYLNNLLVASSLPTKVNYCASVYKRG